MTNIQNFSGFSQEVISFYNELALNNDRDWFNAHKNVYMEKVLEPAQGFVLAMGERLRMLSPNIIADPRTNGSGSIFRIYKDTRFSKDKTPYKTFLGIFFWEGNRKKMENPGLYFQLTPTKLMLFAGMHEFGSLFLNTYRNAVIHPELGPALQKAIKEVKADNDYKIGKNHYKRIPSGYDANHPNADYLLYNGLYATFESDIPDELYSEDLLDFCFEKFQHMLPIHKWVIDMIEAGQ